MIPSVACAFVIESSTPSKRVEVRGDCLAIVPSQVVDARYFIVGATASASPAAETSELSGANLKGILDDAKRAAEGISEPTMSAQASRVLGQVREALRGFDLAGVPRLRAAHHEDGSFSFEWRFADRRLAFTIERDSADSGWYYVSSRSSGDVRAYGGLSELSTRELAAFLNLVLRQTRSA